MIKMDELLNHKYQLEAQTKEIQDNLAVLLERVNKVRMWWSKPMIVTSGLRMIADHLRIYAMRGITDPAKIPMHSRHLCGAAVDIADPHGLLRDLLKTTPSVLETAELWCEDNTDGWVHFQIFPPASGERWFLP